MLTFLSTPARKRRRASSNHAPRVQPVHGRNCICHRCKPNKEAPMGRHA